MLGAPTTQHPYAYGLNNPVRYSDPSGEFALPLYVAIAAVGFIAGMGWDAYQQHQEGGCSGSYNLLRGLSAGAHGAVFAIIATEILVAIPAFTGMVLQSLGMTFNNVALWKLGSSAIVVSQILTYVLHGTQFYVDIVGFRGMGRNAAGEHPLIQAGHAGVSFPHAPGQVLGFHPTQVAVDQQQLYGEGNALDFLWGGGAMQGALQDDTAIFMRANELASQGMNRNGAYPWVYSWRVPLSPWRYAQTALRANFSGTSWYRFPLSGFDLAMPAGCNNCITWPRTVGLPIPEETGKLRYAIPLLKKLGEGRVWHP